MVIDDVEAAGQEAPRTAAMVITSSNVVDVCRIAPMVAVAEAPGSRGARQKGAMGQAGRAPPDRLELHAPTLSIMRQLRVGRGSLSAPVAHVHPERPDPRNDALGH